MKMRKALAPLFGAVCFAVAGASVASPMSYSDGKLALTLHLNGDFSGNSSVSLEDIFGSKSDLKGEVVYVDMDLIKNGEKMSSPSWADSLKGQKVVLSFIDQNPGSDMSDNSSVDDAVQLPEPSMLALLGAGLVAVGLGRRKAKKQS